MIALYSRVSTAEQASEGYSIGEQQSRLQSYCDAMNFKPYTLYTDAGFSGGSTDRPALQDLIRDVKNGKIEKVVVYKLDRLSRSQKDTLELIEDVFLTNGCDFVSVTENFDTATPLGRAMIGILAVFAQLEREQIKERMTIGKEARKKEGKWRGGAKQPIGYDYIDGKLVINEYEAMQVREVFDLFIHGSPPYRIERDFYQKGYQTKYGYWNGLRIKTILRNELYIGNLKLGDETIKGIHEPIIDKETFETAQQIYNNREVHEIRPSNRSYLGGLVYCKQCGAKYGVMQNGNATMHRYYYECYSRRKNKPSMIKDPNCMNKIYRKDELETIVFNEIRKLKLDPERLKGDETIMVDRTATIKKEISRIDAKRNRFFDLYALGSFDAHELEEKIKPLTEQKNRLEEQLMNEAQIRQNHHQKAVLIESFDDVFKHGSKEEIRLIIEELIERIEIDNEDVYIYWSL